MIHLLNVPLKPKPFLMSPPAFPLTSPQVLLLGFAAHTVDPQNRLHVAFVDGWRVQYGLGGPGQTDGQTCSAHQDTCHT